MHDLTTATHATGTQAARTHESRPLAARSFPEARGGDSLGGLAHDARNMVMALSLYCDLLDEPGVLSIASRHYAAELRLVVASSRRLVEKLSLLGKLEESQAARPVAPAPEALERTIPGAEVPEPYIDNLREELLSIESLLRALAGPSIRLRVYAPRGTKPVWLTTEELTRVLVNLVKNAADAATSRIEILLIERAASADSPATLQLVVEDTGPGIPPSQLEAIFAPGFTTSTSAKSDGAAYTSARRGLGLFICRSIVEAAGGRIQARNRCMVGGVSGGARFEIELPVRIE